MIEVMGGETENVWFRIVLEDFFEDTVYYVKDRRWVKL